MYATCLLCAGAPAQQPRVSDRAAGQPDCGSRPFGSVPAAPSAGKKGAISVGLGSVPGKGVQLSPIMRLASSPASRTGGPGRDVRPLGAGSGVNRLLANRLSTLRTPRCRLCCGFGTLGLLGRSSRFVLSFRGPFGLRRLGSRARLSRFGPGRLCLCRPSSAGS